MSISVQQTAVDEFLQWESDARVEVVTEAGSKEKSYFLPLQKVRSYFTANDGRKLNKILTEVFQTKYPPVDSDLILREHTAVFCILLHIGQAKQIEHFARYEELSDRRLPFDVSHPPLEFPTVSADFNLLDQFCDTQATYCVPIFDGSMLHKHFSRQRLLPIRTRRSHGTQGLAKRCIVTVYGPYNKLMPSGSDTKNPYSNTFVLKTYPKDAEAHYKQEVDGFRNVRHAESIIRFYGSYVHGDEYNVLLEYPDKGSLEEYFKIETPPNRGVDIIKFWEGLFSLINGLKAIHSVRLGHHDVKPESVVVVSSGYESPSDWVFKLASVGMSGPKSGPVQDKQTTVDEAEKSSTYAPPEAYTPNHDDRAEKRSSKINWSADIWALGCIFSEASIWIADGYRGLLEYRQQRTAETDRILFKGGDCFHDGERVLQAVLDAHADIEDRLRRSDHITKDVLDTMVDEMLWDEDRPNAKALSRKADMVLSRARQRLAANSADEFSRPSSAQSRAISLPRSAPPTTPLPPLPKGALPNLSSISEIQYPPNVEKWRSQIGPLQSSNGSRSSKGALSSSISVVTRTMSSASVSEYGRDAPGSVASWNYGDDASSIATPNTQYSSPHTSLHSDFFKNEGRPRISQGQQLFEAQSPRQTPSPKAYFGVAAAQPMPVQSIITSRTTSLPQHPPLPTQSIQKAMAHTQTLPEPPRNVEPTTLNHPLLPEPAIEETRPLEKILSSSNSSHPSTVSSQVSDPTSSQKPQKRTGGFSLFPTRNWGSNNRRSSIEKFQNDENVPRYMHRDSVSSSATSKSNPTVATSTQSPSFEYLSLNTCLEWKKAHKKVKRVGKIPPLPGAHLMEDLNGRDHAFIIDDGLAMSPVWPDVTRVFETLSYVIKGMSPLGTELFYTNSYDTYRRKDTTELCTFLESKTCTGETNISYRLNLQLLAYRMKMSTSKGKKGKDALRPISFYVLTNGEWGPGSDAKNVVKTMADYLIAAGYKDKSQVTIEFISFAATGNAMQKINDLAQTDFGLDIVDCTRWTGNVLKMLKGPMNKTLWGHDMENGLVPPVLPEPMVGPGESTTTLVYTGGSATEMA